jgi:hypothetical protein
MHFGENQLSRSLIGLSPLSTAHPLHFQLKWVRSSTTSYRRFNLAMDRSLRFGSRPSDYFALFRLAFATATPLGLTSPLSTNSQAHSSKGTLSPLLRRLQRFVCKRFQVLFHGTCPLSVFWEYLGLSGGPDRFTRDFSGPVILGILLQPLRHFDYRAGTFYGWAFNPIRLYRVVTVAVRQ